MVRVSLGRGEDVEVKLSNTSFNLVDINNINVALKESYATAVDRLKRGEG